MTRPITDSDYDLDSISFFKLVTGTYPNQEIKNDVSDDSDDENEE